MNTMRPIPDMITDLRALANSPEALISHASLLDDAANYIEGTTENLRQQAEQLIAMRVKLEQARPLIEQVVNKLEQEINILYYHRNESPYYMRLYNADMELPRAIKSMLRWWEPGTAEPASISHWGIVK